MAYPFQHLEAASDEAKAMCRDYYADMRASQKAVLDYVESIGGTSARAGSNGKLLCVKFPYGAKPDGWTVDKGHGSSPYVKNAEAHEAIAALPTYTPWHDRIAALDFPQNAYVKSAGYSGSVGPGFFTTNYSPCSPDVLEGPWFIYNVPNLEYERGILAERYEGEVTFDHDTFPNGWALVSEGHVELAFAKSKLEREKAA